MLTFPDFDPVAFSLGPIAVRWYALAYLAGFVLGWRLALWLADRGPALPNKPARRDYDDFVSWGVLGVILGGRIGYVVFYNGPFYLQHPLQALHIWEGGMSFHGGLIGMVTAIILFTRARRINTLAFGDIAATCAPIGLFLGRIANFINGELVGRPVVDPDSVPWAMVFPHIDSLPRHPSQLYEAGLEGALLFTIMIALVTGTKIRARPGMALGVFTCLYAIFRATAELFRTPDAQIGAISAPRWSRPARSRT